MSAVTDLLTTSPKVARAQAEDGFAARLAKAINTVGANKTILAQALGIERSHLYEILDGARDFKAAWVELLPPAIRRVLLVEWADALGEQLEPRPVGGEGDDRRRLSQIVRELQDVIRTETESQEDDFYDAQECERGIAQIEEAERVLAAQKARLRDLGSRRGGPVRRITPAGSAR